MVSEVDPGKPSLTTPDSRGTSSRCTRIAWPATRARPARQKSSQCLSRRRTRIRFCRRVSKWKRGCEAVSEGWPGVAPLAGGADGVQAETRAVAGAASSLRR